MKMTEMRIENASSVNRVIYATNALRSRATITNNATITQTPIQNRNAMKSMWFSLEQTQRTSAITRGSELQIMERNLPQVNKHVTFEPENTLITLMHLIKYNLVSRYILQSLFGRSLILALNTL
jgi:hypothetical protein